MRTTTITGGMVMVGDTVVAGQTFEVVVTRGLGMDRVAATLQANVRILGSSPDPMDSSNRILWYAVGRGLSVPVERRITVLDWAQADWDAELAELTKGQEDQS